MRYTPPPGSTDPEAPYVTGVPGVMRGSPVPAEAVENPQREIVKVITEAGLDPSNEDLTQLWQALQRLAGNIIVTCESEAAALTKEVSLPGFTPSPGSRINVQFSEVNRAASPLLSVNGGAAKPLLHDGRGPDVGDLAKNHIYSLAYTGEAWQIMAGMSDLRVGHYTWWQDTLLRPGLVPCNGCTIENASQYPQIMAYLSTPHGQARCFASLDERNAAHVAAWGAGTYKANWAGVGGLAKFFYDAVNDILYMPDLVGMFEAMGGDGNVAPSTGESMGDRGREVTGHAGIIAPSACNDDIDVDRGVGCFDAVLKAGSTWGVSNPTRNNKYIYSLGFASSRVEPTGAANVPRSFGAVLCAYLGQPSTT